MSLDENEEKRYVKNIIDYSFYGHDEESDEKTGFDGDDELNDSEGDGASEISDCLDLLDDFEFENINPNECCKHLRGSDSIINFPCPFVEDSIGELAILGFFNDFALIDIGMHDFIREVYFEE